MFDSVKFDCPECGAEKAVEAQSKAGECVLDVFDPYQVPAEIAKDCIGDRVQCDECCKIFEVGGPIKIPTVALYLKKPTEND